MTRVFIYEYTCAAPPASLQAGGAASLSTEGDAMLRAVLEDFQQILDVDVVTIRHAANAQEEFRRAARWADWSLVIAPEFEDILLTRCRWVLGEGGRLLGPSPEAVALCGDKLLLAQWWKERGVPTPPTESWVPRLGSFSFPDRTVLKPRFGAGGLHTYFLHGGLFASEAEIPPHPMLKQPYIPGRAASVAFLTRGAMHVPLRSASQILADDIGCHYLGGSVPLDSALEMRAQEVARRAIADVPGLFGYVGVDVVLGDDGRDWAIEINPRLTTSYVGLRALAETNLAEAMLQVAEGREPELLWRAGSVEFSANRSGRCAFTVNPVLRQAEGG